MTHRQVCQPPCEPHSTQAKLLDTGVDWCNTEPQALNPLHALGAALFANLDIFGFCAPLLRASAASSGWALLARGTGPRPWHLRRLQGRSPSPHCLPFRSHGAQCAHAPLVRSLQHPPRRMYGRLFTLGTMHVPPPLMHDRLALAECSSDLLKHPLNQAALAPAARSRNPPVDFASARRGHVLTRAVLTRAASSV